MSHSQLRNDLLDRIKDRHDVWFSDAMELYRMGGLKPGEAAADVLTVTAYQILFLIDFYDLDLDEYLANVKAMDKAFTKQDEP